MRTVGWLKKELEGIKDDVLCYAYEGEVTGIVLFPRNFPRESYGTLYCDEYTNKDNKESEIPDWAKK